jgi:hypothetical protein
MTDYQSFLKDYGIQIENIKNAEDPLLREEAIRRFKEYSSPGDCYSSSEISFPILI